MVHITWKNNTHCSFTYTTNTVTIQTWLKIIGQCKALFLRQICLGMTERDLYWELDITIHTVDMTKLCKFYHKRASQRELHVWRAAAVSWTKRESWSVRDYFPSLPCHGHGGNEHCNAAKQIQRISKERIIIVIFLMKQSQGPKLQPLF